MDDSLRQCDSYQRSLAAACRLLVISLHLILLNSCALTKPSPQTSLPQEHVLHLDQLVIHSDQPLSKRHRLLEELVKQRTEVAQNLNVEPCREPIQVFLFGSADRFESYIKQSYPALPSRRAFFVESDRRYAVFAHWGERVDEDLRHEVTHGYLHASVSNLPLWLDEGIAEYFEVPRELNGLNLPHVHLLRDRLANNSWQPDLPRLEQLKDLATMSQQDYAESWLWVHMLLRSSPMRLEVLHNFIEELQTDASRAPISLRLREKESNPHRSLLEHLRWLEAEGLPATQR